MLCSLARKWHFFTFCKKKSDVKSYITSELLEEHRLYDQVKTPDYHRRGLLYQAIPIVNKTNFSIRI